MSSLDKKVPFEQREVNVGRDRMAGDAMQENVRMLLLCRQAGFTCNSPKQPKKLSAIEPATLLAQEIGAVMLPDAEPFS
jgi:hypothetical protein